MATIRYSKHIISISVICFVFILLFAQSSNATDFKSRINAFKNKSKTYTDTEHNYKITAPKTWKHSFSLDGTDHVRAFLSPDKNIVLKIRSFTVHSKVTVELIRKLFEKNILVGGNLITSSTGFADDIPTSIGTYISVFNNITIGIKTVYFIKSGIAYIVWSTIPEYMFKYRSKEIDSVLNTFKFIK
ncbi:hypothetical protein KAJ27_12600 [bacterium]|nr:hypothetical protein [bacterium]